MKRHLPAAALAVGLFTLETAGGCTAGLFGMHPGLVLLFVVAIAMRRGEGAGAAWGILLGFLEDTFSGGLTGANVLTKGLLGFITGSLRGQLDCENPNTQAIVAALATLAEGLVHLALLEVFSEGRGVVAPFLGSIAPAAALNGALLPVAVALSRARPRRRAGRAATSGA